MFRKILLLIFVITFINSCGVSPGRNLIKKNSKSFGIELTLPVMVSIPTVGVMYIPFPIISYRYGINDNINLIYRNYPFMLYFGVLANDITVVSLLSKQNNLIPEMIGYFALATVIKYNDFSYLPIFPNIGLNIGWYNKDSNRLYISIEVTIDFRGYTNISNFSSYLNLKIGNSFRLKDNINFNIELSQNGIGKLIGNPNTIDNVKEISFIKFRNNYLGSTYLNAGIDIIFD